MTTGVERIEPGEYRRLNLRAHSFLYDVPLHDVWTVELPGGGSERTMQEVLEFFSAGRIMATNVVVRRLFLLRGWLGRVFRWDPDADDRWEGSFIGRLTEAEQRQSLVAPGTPDGPFRILYVFTNEAVSEIVNATAHAFSTLALQRSANGYRLYWAIYVRPVGPMTRYYLALIEPFRRFIVYPAILRQIRTTWERLYAG